jgi:hypothetical protein
MWGYRAVPAGVNLGFVIARLFSFGIQGISFLRPFRLVAVVWLLGTGWRQGQSYRTISELNRVCARFLMRLPSADGRFQCVANLE